MAVRITSGTTNRTYLKNLNGSQHAMNKAMERVESGRDFQRVSDNVTQATRAINVRSRIYRNEQMTNNVNTAAEQLNMAESALSQMNDICSNVQSEMFKALNTPTLQAGKETFSAFLDGAKDEFMRLANTKYNDKYVLGGLGIDVAPFKANADGNMVFDPQSGNSKNLVKLTDMVDKNQLLADVEPYEVDNASTLSITDNCANQVYTCVGTAQAKLGNIDDLKKYLNINDLDEIISKYGQNVSNDPNDWNDGHFWYPGGGCIHDDGEKGFVGHLKNGEEVVIPYKDKYGQEYTLNIPSDKSSVIKPLSAPQIKNSVENYYYDGNPVKYTGDSYIDMGLDISVTANGKVAPKTAFKTTVDGIAAMGYGYTTVSYDDILGIQASAGAQGSGSGKPENVSNNIYDMMTQMQDAINSLDDKNSNIGEVIDKISAVMYNFQKQTDKIIAAESELGVRSKFLETNLDRLEQENSSLKKMQKDIEGVDDATEITNFLGYQNAWNLVMQFGKNIVPKSLMDYVN